MQDYETDAREDDRLELRTWLRLVTCCNLMEREIRVRLRDSATVTLPQFDLLAVLARAPDGLVMGDISRRLMVTNGNVTALVDRLVREGLLEREVNPRDRRALVVRLSEQGWRVFNTVAPAHNEWIDELMRDIPRDKVEALYDLLADLKLSVSEARTS
ncbi:MarR family winged helix-turn-helix transcriptional regulator [Caenispirillum salinarum]|uniref:MarR family winged helix-turn-helix transcriptional regulator n=1 Tax=Caenispirillum salinarum TaxID=859058 RepID=UPI003850FDBA